MVEVASGLDGDGAPAFRMANDIVGFFFYFMVFCGER